MALSTCFWRLKQILCWDAQFPQTFIINAFIYPGAGISPVYYLQLTAKSLPRHYPQPKDASLPKAMPSSLRQICFHSHTKATAIYLALISGSCYPHCHQEAQFYQQHCLPIALTHERRKLLSNASTLLNRILLIALVNGVSSGASCSNIVDGWLFSLYVVPSLRRRQWHPTPVLLPRKSHERSNLVGYSPWGH